MGIRCTARLAIGARRWHGEVFEVDADGCLLASTRAMRRGEAVYVTIRLRGREFSTPATVAWCTEDAPHRTGLEFSRAGRAARGKRLLAALDSDAAAIERRPRSQAPPRGIRAASPSAPRDRPMSAQRFVELANAERAAGRLRHAVEWLRAALMLAPADGEIAVALDELEGSGSGPRTHVA